MGSTKRANRGQIKPAFGGTGLLLVDVINPLNFEGATTLSSHAMKAVPNLLRLRKEADALGVPVIYVNDNYGHWGSDRRELIDKCAKASSLAQRLISRVRPRLRDHFVIKPQFSAFYATNLPVLLPALGVRRLVLTGFAADICVLFTAADAHMRQYELWTPSDAVASEEHERKEWALKTMRTSMGAETRTSAELTLKAWAER